MTSMPKTSLSVEILNRVLKMIQSLFVMMVVIFNLIMISITITITMLMMMMMILL